MEVNANKKGYFFTRNCIEVFVFFVVEQPGLGL